eukprot:scaffold50158_cov21-Tisochrysis_lutea.AAC.1
MAICWMILMPVCRACGVRKSEKQERGRLEKGGKGGTVLNTALAFKSMDAKHVTAAGSQAHFSSKKVAPCHASGYTATQLCCRLKCLCPHTPHRHLPALQDSG